MSRMPPTATAWPAGVDEILAVAGQRGFARGAGLQIVDLTNLHQPVPRGGVALTRVLG